MSDADWRQATRPAYWDNWWAAQRYLSRAEWAEESLARWQLGSGVRFTDVWLPAYAAEYLLTVQHNSPQLLSRLSEHRSWFVRLTVAETVAAYDRKRAGRLMIREFGSRYVSACQDASARLGRLTRRNHTINCYSPAEREQAAAHWTRAIGELR